MIEISCIGKSIRELEQEVVERYIMRSERIYIMRSEREGAKRNAISSNKDLSNEIMSRREEYACKLIAKHATDSGMILRPEEWPPGLASVCNDLWDPHVSTSMVYRRARPGFLDATVYSLDLKLRSIYG